MEALVQLGLGGGALAVLAMLGRSLLSPIVKAHVETLAQLGTTLGTVGVAMTEATRALSLVVENQSRQLEHNADVAAVLRGIRHTLPDDVAERLRRADGNRT